MKKNIMNLSLKNSHKELQKKSTSGFMAYFRLRFVLLW